MEADGRYDDGYGRDTDDRYDESPRVNDRYADKPLHDITITNIVWCMA